MKIVSLNMEKLDIPFRVEFQHSSAERTATESVLVVATDDSGTQYQGEGCPRSYVTSETISSAMDFFRKTRNELSRLNSINSLIEWMGEHTQDIDMNPAAFCAIEMALINAFAGSSSQTVESLLQLSELSGEFKYTAVLGTKTALHFQAQLQQYSELGFNDFKIKLFGTREIDLPNIKILNDYSSEQFRFRFDANNLWSHASQVVSYIEDFELPLFAIEEPVGVGDLDECRKIANRLGLRIILDESFVRLEQFDLIKSDPEHWIINIRLSKMGGILRSLNIASCARDLGIPIIIGAQVGETSLLTRAAITVANNYRGILLAQEGAFGTHLLEYDLIDPPLMFSDGGVIDASRII